MKKVKTIGDYSVTTDGTWHYLWYKERYLVVKNTEPVCSTRLLKELKAKGK